jgi:choline dehydrogenase-like flavoprotein
VNIAQNSKDFIVIGAGAAGCLLANRLSRDPAARVALIEAGPSDLHFPVNLKTTLPIGNVFLLPYARYNWQHVYIGGPEVNGRRIPCPRGKLFGCTSVNGTVYMRGHPTNGARLEMRGGTTIMSLPTISGTRITSAKDRIFTVPAENSTNKSPAKTIRSRTP